MAGGQSGLMDRVAGGHSGLVDRVDWWTEVGDPAALNWNTTLLQGPFGIRVVLILLKVEGD